MCDCFNTTYTFLNLTVNQRKEANALCPRLLGPLLILLHDPNKLVTYASALPPLSQSQTSTPVSRRERSLMFSSLKLSAFWQHGEIIPSSFVSICKIGQETCLDNCLTFVYVCDTFSLASIFFWPDLHCVPHPQKHLPAEFSRNKQVVVIYRFIFFCELKQRRTR